MWILASFPTLNIISNFLIIIKSDWLIGVLGRVGGVGIRWAHSKKNQLISGSPLRYIYVIDTFSFDKYILALNFDMEALKYFSNFILKISTEILSAELK